MRHSAWLVRCRAAQVSCSIGRSPQPGRGHRHGPCFGIFVSVALIEQSQSGHRSYVIAAFCLRNQTHRTRPRKSVGCCERSSWERTMPRNELVIAGLCALLVGCDVSFAQPEGPQTRNLRDVCIPTLTAGCGHPWVLTEPTSATMSVGDTLRLRARYFDSRNTEISNTEFEWTQVDTSAIRVSRSGLVTAIRAVPYSVHVSAVATHDRTYALTHIRVVQ